MRLSKVAMDPETDVSCCSEDLRCLVLQGRMTRCSSLSHKTNMVFLSECGGVALVSHEGVKGGGAVMRMRQAACVSL